MALLEAMLKISDKVPGLRIVLDHLPNFEPTPDERPAYAAALKEFAKRPQIYVKLSAILRQVDGRVSTDVNSYRDKLDLLVATFGDDRILFGSDWPNSDGVAPVDQVFKIAKDYFASKPRALAEKELLEKLHRCVQVGETGGGTAFTLASLTQRHRDTEFDHGEHELEDAKAALRWRAIGAIMGTTVKNINRSRFQRFMF